jgi:hypothetical protein
MDGDGNGDARGDGDGARDKAGDRLVRFVGSLLSNLINGRGVRPYLVLLLPCVRVLVRVLVSIPICTCGLASRHRHPGRGCADE